MRSARRAEKERVDVLLGSLAVIGAILVHEIWSRLASLNHAHEKAVEVQHTYVPRSQHQSDIERVEQKVLTLRDDAIGHRGRSEGVSNIGRLIVAVATVLGVILTIVILISSKTI
jgi:hypothetical protein